MNVVSPTKSIIPETGIDGGRLLKEMRQKTAPQVANLLLRWFRKRDTERLSKYVLEFVFTVTDKQVDLLSQEKRADAMELIMSKTSNLLEVCLALESQSEDAFLAGILLLTLVVYQNHTAQRLLTGPGRSALAIELFFSGRCWGFGSGIPMNFVLEFLFALTYTIDTKLARFLAECGFVRLLSEQFMWLVRRLSDDPALIPENIEFGLFRILSILNVTLAYAKPDKIGVEAHDRVRREMMEDFIPKVVDGFLFTHRIHAGFDSVYARVFESQFLDMLNKEQYEKLVRFCVRLTKTRGIDEAKGNIYAVIINTRRMVYGKSDGLETEAHVRELNRMRREELRIDDKSTELEKFRAMFRHLKPDLYNIHEARKYEFTKCSLPECRSVGGNDLKVCSGCGIVRFCSKDCQRKHWKAGHRLECKSLRLVSS